MQSFLSDNILWLKSLHLIAVMSWMAGLLYLPRLFVYHTRAEAGSGLDQTFQVMEQKLLRIIMNPAMIASWVFGLLLLAARADLQVAPGEAGYWFPVKFLAVVAMTGFHMVLARWRRDFTAGRNSRSERRYRAANEIPTVLMIIIVILAVVEPF